MLNILESDKDLWRSARLKKNVYITFPELNITLTNHDIVNESLQLIESIESDTNLTFQGCIASKFKVTLIDFVRDVRNEYLEVEISTGTFPNESERIPLFRGYVADQSNATHEDIQTKLTCYDPLKKVLDADVTYWYNHLTFPITLKNMRDSFFTRVGMIQENTNLANDNLVINKSITDSNIYGREIIRDLCQLNGVFGQFGRDGIFHYHRLTASIEAIYPAEDLYPADDLYPAEANAQERVFKSVYYRIDYQPYHTKLISRVIIVGEDGSQHGAYGDTTGDTFYIQDNKLAWGTDGNVASEVILNVVKNISFTPATINAKGLPYLECGDIIVSNTRINVVQSYITTRTLEGIQDLRDTFDSDSTQQRKAYRLSQATEISTNEIKTQAAQTTASAAQTTASAAQGAASSAQGAASEADRKARNAQGTADDAIYRVGVIEADYVKTGTIEAINAKFNSLNASNITTGTLNVNRLNMSAVNSALQSYTIRCQNLYSAGTVQATGGALIGSTVSCDRVSIGGHTCTLQSKRISGVTINYIGY